MASLIRYLGTHQARWRFLHVIRRAYALFGRSWNDFYARMLNFQDRHLTLDQILSRPKVSGRFKGLWDWGRGEQCLAFMQRHGLKPEHSVLDFGCGYGRVAIPLLREQTTGGRYVGVEITDRRLELAREWIAREGLTGKNFELVLSKDNTMPYLDDASVDVVWVLSVFNHMPDGDLETCLKAMRRVLRPGGMLFCYYEIDVNNDTNWVHSFRRSDAQMRALLSRLGFDHRSLDDWNDDLGDAKPKEARMLLATPAP